MQAYHPTIASAATGSSVAHGFAGGTPLAQPSGVVSGLGGHFSQHSTPGAGATPTHSSHFANTAPQSAMPPTGQMNVGKVHVVHPTRA